MARRSKSARKSSKRSRRGRRTMRGGWQKLSPATVNDTSMDGPKQMSSLQGQEYAALHEGQHGGAQAYAGAPAFQSDTLPSSLVESARTGGTLHALSEIQGMKDADMAGGARRRRKTRGGQMNNNGNSNNNSNNMNGGRRRRGKKSRKSRKASRKGRKATRRRQGGGSHVMHPADASAPGMLLGNSSARAAEGAMNPEWQLAKDPRAFAPM